MNIIVFVVFIVATAIVVVIVIVVDDIAAVSFRIEAELTEDVINHWLLS